MSKIDHKAMLNIGVKLFTDVGVDKDEAKLVVESLIDTSLKGIDSHGVNLIPRYLDSIKSGKIIPNQEPQVTFENSSFINVSGEKGFGQVTATFGIKEGIKKAKKEGMAIVGLHNTNHIGTLGQYNSMASYAGGLICFSVCNGGANVAPHGGNKRYLGTNPISFTVPTKDKNPIIVDFATSVFPERKIREYRDKDIDLPTNIILDSDGNPSTNPNDFYNGGSILPIGNHKGYGLSLMVEILGGLFTGAGFHGLGESTSTNGVMFMLFEPTMFRGKQFYDDIDKFIKELKKQPTINGPGNILLPGEIELLRMKENKRDGITISPTLSKQLGLKTVGMNNYHMDTDTLTTDSIVLDIGANMGEYTNQISRQYACNIYAYEPTPDLFEILDQRYTNVKKINILNDALWTEDTTKDFYEYSCSQGRANSFGAKKNHYAHDTNVLSVRTKSLDSVVKRFDTVDICKMDIEGAEVEVLLKTSDETLLKCNQICAEFHCDDFTIKNTQKGLDSFTKKDVQSVISRLNKIGFKHLITELSEVDGSPKYIVFYQEEKINE